MTRVAVVLGLGCLGCDVGSDPGPGQAVFEVRACRGSIEEPRGESFRVAIDDAATTRQASALVGQPGGPIVHGRLVVGNGGFNVPWSWHLDPATVRFVDAAIEVCDACPSLVEANLPAFERLGTYCPWSTEVVRRLR